MRIGTAAARSVLSVCLATGLIGGCGMSQMPSLGEGGLFSSGKKAASWTPIITEDSMIAAARTNSDGPLDSAASSGCPQLQVEGGQRSITLYEDNRIGKAAAVVHQSEITKTARECQVSDGVAQIKYGVAGRLVLGPKGKPGTVTLPMTMQVFDKAKIPLKSEPFTVTVTVTKENRISYFAVVRDVVIPVKEGVMPQDYSIVIAFDKAGAA